MSENQIYPLLSEIVCKPRPWEAYTAETLWNTPHIAARMMEYHMDPESIPASRPHAFIDTSAAWIADRFNLNPGIRVADFGCGPGLYARRFASTGAAVTGIDFSRNSIAWARKQASQSNQEIHYIEGNYLEIHPDGPFDLITLIYCDYCALSPAQRSHLLQKFRELLAPGGSILLDVFSTKAMEARKEGSELASRLMEGFWAEGDYVGLRQTWKYTRDSVVLDRYDIFQKDGSMTVYNWLQYFHREALSREFAENGLRITEWYGDVSGASPLVDDELYALVAVRDSE